MFGIYTYAVYFCLAGFFSIGLFNITLLLWPIRSKGEEIDIYDLPNEIWDAYTQRISNRQSVLLAVASLLLLIVWSLAVWWIPRILEVILSPNYFDFFSGVKLISIPNILIMCCVIFCISALENLYFRKKVLNKFRESGAQQIK
ncbi:MULTISPECIES: hypothetical protein [Bacillus]|uniref:hypothetical protein n=1 Tax=Bacillus TaxID=1386 RepID=UPI00397BBFCC